MAEITLGRDSNDTKRPVGYLDAWHPYKKNQIRLAQVQQILEEYQEHLPLTVRQIYYRMIAVYRHPKGDSFRDSLYDLMVNARRAGDIPFESIRDDGIQGGGYWDPDLDSHLRSIDRVLTNYDADRQAGQDIRLEAWCESAGMLPQLRRICDDYSIPVYSCGGFNSVTAVKRIAETVAAYDQDTVMLHLGDYDPSGISIYERVVRDVQAFLADDAPHREFRGVRVVLTEEQIAEYGLPMERIETEDTRSKASIKAGLTEKCELEALAPDQIARILRERIDENIDPDQREETLEREEQDRARLESLPSVISMVSAANVDPTVRPWTILPDPER